MGPIADQVIQKIKQAAGLYHRLMLVVDPPGAGKTTALTCVKERVGVPLINVNLELLRRTLELTERQRALLLARLFQSAIVYRAVAPSRSQLRLARLFQSAIVMSYVNKYLDALRLARLFQSAIVLT